MRQVFKDKNNKDSSKRVWGVICLIVGLIMALTVCTVYMVMAFKGITIDMSQLTSVFTPVFGAGTALLGVGVFEKDKNYAKNK